MSELKYVTKSRMPKQEEFFRQCHDIFDASWITNNGPYVQKLENSLNTYLGVSHLIACNNGTTALMLAIQNAGLAGKKVAVTPYTYVATLSALLWLGCEPIFVDVDPDTLCLSPDFLRQLFIKEPDIAGVLPVHIYGLACDVENLEAICREHGAALIYDGAQAFGSRYNGKSLLAYGDYSICSFHATKIFHTAEGGCVISHTDDDHEALSLTRAFGHINDTHYCLGINGKMSELHAAMGLTLLPGTDEEIAKRRQIHAIYNDAFANIKLLRPAVREGMEWNYSYYPVQMIDENLLLKVLGAFNAQGIYPRRYFYPALNTLPYLKPEWKTSCPNAEKAASSTLCLPMHGDIGQENINNIASILLKSI